MDFLNPQFLDSVGKLGPLAVLLIVVLAFIAFLVINSKNNSKSNDNQTAIINQTGVMQNAYNDLMKQMLGMMGEMQSGAAERNKQIEGMAQVQQATNTVIGDLKKVVEDHSTIVESTVKSHSILDEHVVSAFNDTSNAVSATGESVQQNSNANTEKIINEVKNLQTALENPDSVLRKDAKDHADRIIGAFKSLMEESAQKDTQIKTLTQRLFDLQAKNAGIPTGDPDPTIPLVKMLPDPIALSPVDGEINRELIDKVKTSTGEHPTQGAAK